MTFNVMKWFSEFKKEDRLVQELQSNDKSNFGYEIIPEEEKTNRTLILETISGIQEGMNPRVLEELLKTFLPESQRANEDKTE